MRTSSYHTCPGSVFPAQQQDYISTVVSITMERGAVSTGQDPKTSKNYFPKLELVRLTIPRRVYPAHMDVVSESVAQVYKDRRKIKGLK